MKNKNDWFDEYKAIADKYFLDTEIKIDIGEWDCYEQYYLDGYSPRDAFNEDINTDLI